MYCEMCGKEILTGDIYYFIDKVIMCKKCADSQGSKAVEKGEYNV